MRRTRLVDLASTGEVVALEAQSGAGKSTLLDQLVANHDGPCARVTLTASTAARSQLRPALRRSLRDHGLSDLAMALEPSADTDALALVLPWQDDETSLLVVVDDVHLGDDDLVEALAGMATRWPVPHRLVLAGRRLPGPLTTVVERAGGHVIGPADLRFDPDETRQLIGAEVAHRLDDTEIALLTQRCDGWAAAVTLAAERLRRSLARSQAAFAEELGRLLARPVTLDDLLASLLDGAPEQLRGTITRLAGLPGLDDLIVREAGWPGGLASITDLGLPLVEATLTGMWALPNAVREVVASATASPELARFAARRYLDLGHPGAALEVLSAPGLQRELAGLLADLSPAQRTQLDASEHAAAVGTLPAHLLGEHPRILVDLADLYLLAGRLEDYRGAIRRARALVDDDPDAPDDDTAEVLAADVTMRAAANDDDSLVGEVGALLARDDLPPMARARLLGAVGRVTASRRTASALRDGAQRLDDAAQLFRQLGATTHAAALWTIAAAAATWPLGRHDEALEQLDQALAIDPSRRTRLGVLPYRAFILVDVGRYAEAQADLAELRRAARTPGTLANERSAAFARWGAAKLASQQGDADATWAACHAVEASDVVVDTGHGAFFRADAAQLLARVGLREEAERLLADARARDPGTTKLVTLTAFVLAAYAGDLERAEQALGELDAGDAVEPRDRWRVTLLHAYVRHLAGASDVRSLAAAAFEQAAQLGQPNLPMTREPAVARILLPLAAESSASARDAAQATRARVRVIGGLTVDVEGRRTEPSGRPGELIAFLALNQRARTTEQAIEALWPDSDPSRGRQRLRTVLRRVRRDHGELIERHDDVVRFQAGVQVDADEFAAFVQQARDPQGNRAEAAAAALALYDADDTPHLAYHDWAIAARQRLRRQALAMHDLLAAAAESEGRLDDGIRTHLVAIEMDPTAETRYLAAARMLAEQGRRSRALQLLHDAVTALTQQGLEPSPELARFEGYLRRGPSVGSRAS